MIKELLEQLAPLDAQIAALRGGAQDEESQMAAITAHASELAELAVEEDEILRCCGPLTAEDPLIYHFFAFRICYFSCTVLSVQHPGIYEQFIHFPECHYFYYFHHSSSIRI